jgi:hypothetical protein
MKKSFLDLCVLGVFRHFVLVQLDLSIPPFSGFSLLPSRSSCSFCGLEIFLSSLSTRQGPVLILLRACPGQLIPGSVRFWWH